MELSEGSLFQRERGAVHHQQDPPATTTGTDRSACYGRTPCDNITEQRFIHEHSPKPRLTGRASRAWARANSPPAGRRWATVTTTAALKSSPSARAVTWVSCRSTVRPATQTSSWAGATTYPRVIFPTLRYAFKSRDLERLYQRYFLGQRRKSVVSWTFWTWWPSWPCSCCSPGPGVHADGPESKECCSLLHTGIEVVICALVVVRKDTSSHGYLQYSGAVTWVAMATQILATGLGLRFARGWDRVRALHALCHLQHAAAASHLGHRGGTGWPPRCTIAIQLLVPPRAQISTNQVRQRNVRYCIMPSLGATLDVFSARGI